MNYLKKIALLAVSPNYYRTVAGKSVGQGIGYLFGVLLILSLLHLSLLLVIGFRYLPELQRIADQAPQHLSTIYPADLTLTFQNNELTVNQPQPYFIDLPEFLASAKTDSDSKSFPFEHLVAIDTNANADEFTKYQSLLLLTKTAMVFPDKNETLKMKLYSEMSIENGYRVDQQSVHQALQKAAPYFQYIPPAAKIALISAAVIGPIFVALGLIIYYLIFAAIISVVVHLVALMLGAAVGYSRTVALTLHGVTLPILLEEVSKIVLLQFPTGTFSLITIVWMAVVLHTMSGNAKVDQTPVAAPG